MDKSTSLNPTVIEHFRIATIFPLIHAQWSDSFLSLSMFARKDLFKWAEDFRRDHHQLVEQLESRIALEFSLTELKKMSTRSNPARTIMKKIDLTDIHRIILHHIVELTSATATAVNLEDYELAEALKAVSDIELTFLSDLFTQRNHPFDLIRHTQLFRDLINSSITDTTTNSHP